jgi:hypothetical protein
MAVSGAGDVRVPVEQIYAHATNLRAMRERFSAVRGASAHIAGGEQAYGTLCGWIHGVLQGRHTRQEELLDYVAENLELAAGALQGAADGFQAEDMRHAIDLNRAGGR